MKAPTESLAHRLCYAFKSGPKVRLRLASQVMPASFGGVEGNCHENAECWVNKHPEYFIVEGYIRAGAGKYAPHSVVRNAVGELTDVTLPAESVADHCVFVRHTDVSNEPFARMASIDLPIEEQIREMQLPRPTLMSLLPETGPDEVEIADYH